jgi:hypothetical protein
MLILIREPVLMEDEGNLEVLGVFDNFSMLAIFCKSYTDDDKGYFKVHDIAYIGDSDFILTGKWKEKYEKYIPKRFKYFTKTENENRIQELKNIINELEAFSRDKVINYTDWLLHRFNQKYECADILLNTWMQEGKVINDITNESR